MCEVPSLGSSIWTLGPKLVALFWKVVETLGAVTQLAGVPRDKSGGFYLLPVPVWVLCFLPPAITWPVTSNFPSHRLSNVPSCSELKSGAMSWSNQHFLEQLRPGIVMETWKIFHVLSLPAMKSWLKTTWERKPLFGSQAMRYHCAKPGQSSRLEQEHVQNIDFWLAPHGLPSLLSYVTQDHLPKGGSTHSGLNPPTSIINEENVS